MNPPRILITDLRFPDDGIERTILTAAGFELQATQCATPVDVAAAGADADALLVNMAPVPRETIAALRRCRIIVRYGVGVDNVDGAAARDRGIAVCNVPDYGVDEVADHAVALALALARRLPLFDARVRAGGWSSPLPPLPAFGDMLFAVAGLGRIGRAVLARAAGFRFKLGAYDPPLPDAAFAAAGAARLSADELFRQADVLSLHLPLMPETRHFVSAERLRTMKPHAVIVNTARGGLLDSKAVADALAAGRLGGAGVDVYETESVPPDHPLRGCPNALLTPHVAWYSDASQPRLRRMAAEEVVRGLRGEPLRNRVNG